MFSKTFILLCYCLLLVPKAVNSQCIASDSLWKRLIYLKDQGSAISVNDQLLELQRYETVLQTCHHNLDSAGALLLFRIGAMKYKQGNYLEAIAYAQQSIAINRSVKAGAAINAKHLIGTYFYLSLFYASLNNVSEKMKALDSCALLAVRLNAVDIFCLNALYQRVEYFFDIGDYHRSFSYAEQCEKLATVFSGKGSEEYNTALGYISDCFGWKINVLIKLGDYALAETLLDRKIEELRKSKMEMFLGTIYRQLADVQVQKADYKNALLSFNKSLFYNHKFGLALNQKISLTGLGYSLHFRHDRNCDKALTTFREAMNCINRDASLSQLDSMESLNILGNMAIVFAQKKMYDSAHCYFQLAFNQLKAGTNETKVLYSPFGDILKKKIDYLTGLVIDKADAYAKEYNETKNPGLAIEAIRIYKVADQLLDRVKAEQNDVQSKLVWRMDSRRLYENAIRACNRSRNVNAAFYFFEKSKAVMLFDKLNENRWLGEDDILKQVQLKKNIYQREKEIKELDPSSAAYEKKRQEIFSGNQELDRLVNNIKNTNPLYYQAYLDTGKISLADVHKNILNDHDAFIELFAGDSSVFCMVISKTETSLYEIEKVKFDKLVAVFISLVSNPALLNKQAPLFFSTAAQLYQNIFQNKPVPAGRIIISPDGYYFPFEALVVNTNPVTYFLEEHAISYAYSARYLMNKFYKDKEVNHSANFLGVAPVQFAASLNLAPLQGSDLSLKQLNSYFAKSENLVGVAATKSSFLQNYSKYSVIQLYTHASDSSTNGEPVIYFSDSLLYLSELNTERRPQTKLIILSACETGLGKLFKGEGVFSFNRGFAALGIPAAITNLWSVDDASTYKVNELFFKYLSKGLPTDIALQKAKLDFIKNASREERLPCHWAAIILAGATETIDCGPVFPRRWIFLFFIVIAGGSIAIWFWIKKGRSAASAAT